MRRLATMSDMRSLSLAAVGGTLLLALTSCSAPPAHADEATAAGEAVFRRNCMVCHTTDGKNRVGPTLAGVYGRKAGTQAAFANQYSDANKNSNLVWDDEHLDAYLASPATAMPGNKMAYAGLKNPNDRRALIAYLKTLK